MVDLRPDVEVRADGGVVFVKTSVSPSKEMDLVLKIKETVANVPGASDVRVQAEWPSPYV